MCGVLGEQLYSSKSIKEGITFATMDTSNITAQPAYQRDIERREELAALVERTIQALIGLDLNEETEIARTLKQTVLRDTFKVMVIGEFKTGKSTFINALLGDEVLPSYARPCTAIVAEVKYGEARRAILHWRDDSRPPFEIPVEELEQYVVIQQDEADVRESPYSKVELYWPLPILEQNVEIIDSPGLNENEIREKVTLEYLRRVDAILFVFTATRLGPSIHEAEAIDNLRNAGHEEIFFVINRWDELRAKDRPEVQTWAQSKLAPLSKRDESLYYVSSLDALDGRLENDTVRVARSGIETLEASLTLFLINDRARVKLLRAAQELSVIIRTGQQSVPHLRGMLEKPLDQLRQDYQEADNKLHELELDAKGIILRVTNFRADMRELVRNKTREFYFNVDSQVETWLADLQIGLLEGMQPEKVGEKIGKHLESKLRAEAERWGSGTLRPFVEDRMASLQRELISRADAFEQKLEQTQFDLSGFSSLSDPASKVALDGAPKNALERALAAAGGWILGGPAMAATGAVFGVSEIVKDIVPQFIAILAAALIGLPFLPVTIVVATVTGGLKLRSIGDQLKKKVALKFREELHKVSADHAEKMSKQVDTELRRLEEQLRAGLEVRIATVRNQAESTLASKEKDEANVAARKQAINRLEAELINVNSDLLDFTTRLVAP